MKQIITQHGWGLDKSFWEIYKLEFQKNNWYWQDNERGYFSKNPYHSKWIHNNSQEKINMILCHSLGFHLMKKSLFEDATHLVLINSFNNFLPSHDKKNFVLRSLKRMEKKIIKYEAKDMLKEFIDKSFKPNIINNDFQNILNRNLDNINNRLLLNDLKRLYIKRNHLRLTNKNCNIIFIQSENDLILDKDASNNFLESLNRRLDKESTLIKLSNQGHCLADVNLYKIINRTFGI